MGLTTALSLPCKVVDLRFKRFAGKQAALRRMVLDELKLQSSGSSMRSWSPQAGAAAWDARFPTGDLSECVLPLPCGIGVLFWVRCFEAEHCIRTPSLFLISTKAEYTLF